MNVAMMQVGPPVRPLWINLGRTLSSNGFDVFYFGPSPAFEALLNQENLGNSLAVYDRDESRPLPNTKRREQVLEYNREYLGWSRQSLEQRCQNAAYYFDAYGIDLALFWNDIDVEYLVANVMDVHKLHLENGYLPETIQIDTEGVNHNASYTKYNYEEILDVDPLWKPELDVNPVVKEVPTLGIEKKLRALFRTRNHRGNFVWTVRDELSKRVSSLRRHFDDPGDSGLPDQYIFVPFQVHDDTQILYNSPYIDDMYTLTELVTNSVDNLDENIDIVVKEHPADRGRIDYSDLRKRHEEVIWLKEFPIEKVVEGARAVVTVNSSVGFQALDAGVPVVTLGKSFYDSNPFVQHPTNPDEVQDAIGHALEKTLDIDAIEDYIESFRRNLFISGGIHSLHPHTIQQISSAIYNVAN